MKERVKPSASRLPRLCTSAGTASSQRSILRCAPTTPVERGRISSCPSPIRPATIACVARQLASPSSPVQALACPALASTARTARPRARISWQTSTGAALKRFCVNMPASTAGVSETMRPRSSRPAFLKLAAAAPALNPLGKSFCMGALLKVCRRHQCRTSAPKPRATRHCAVFAWHRHVRPGRNLLRQPRNLCRFLQQCPRR